MDENPLGCNSLHCSLQLVLFECTVPFSHISVKGAQDEAVCFLLHFLLYGRRISCNGSGPRDILLQTFRNTKDSNKRSFSCLFWFSSPFFKKTVLCTASKTENISVPPIVSARFSYIYSSPYFHPLYLSRIYQRKQRRQTCYRFVRASNRSFA